MTLRFQREVLHGFSIGKFTKQKKNHHQQQQQKEPPRLGGDDSQI